MGCMRSYLWQNGGKVISSLYLFFRVINIGRVSIFVSRFNLNSYYLQKQLNIGWWQEKSPQKVTKICLSYGLYAKATAQTLLTNISSQESEKKLTLVIASILFYCVLLIRCIILQYCVTNFMWQKSLQKQPQEVFYKKSYP